MTVMGTVTKVPMKMKNVLSFQLTFVVVVVVVIQVIMTFLCIDFS